MQDEFKRLVSHLTATIHDQTIFRAAIGSVTLELAFKALVDANILDPLQEDVLRQFVAFMMSETIRRSAGRTDLVARGRTRAGNADAPTMGMVNRMLTPRR